MRRVELKHIPVRPRDPFRGWQGTVQWILLALLAAAVCFQCAEMVWGVQIFRRAHTMDCLTLFLAVAATMASLVRQLPAQNVILAAGVAGLAGAAAEWLSAIAAVPFGPIVYNAGNSGRFIVQGLPWSAPFIWVVVLLNSRGVARLGLRRHRRAAYYGFWVIGVAAVLVAVFQFSLEPFATQVKQFWSWQPTKIHSDWFGAPWVNFIACAATAAIILLFVTPALISKSPGPPPPPSLQPLILWELLSLLLLIGQWTRHLRTAWAFTIGQMLIVAAAALVGSRTRQPERATG